MSSALRASGALRLQILSPQPKQEDSWKRESFFVKGKATSSKPEVAGVLAASRLRSTSFANPVPATKTRRLVETRVFFR